MLYGEGEFGEGTFGGAQGVVMTIEQVGQYGDRKLNLKLRQIIDWINTSGGGGGSSNPEDIEITIDLGGDSGTHTMSLQAWLDWIASATQDLQNAPNPPRHAVMFYIGWMDGWQTSSNETFDGGRPPYSERVVLLGGTEPPEWFNDSNDVWISQAALNELDGVASTISDIQDEISNIKTRLDNLESGPPE